MTTIKATKKSQLTKMDIALLSVQTSLGIIEDLVSEPFPNILNDLPSDKEMAKSTLQIRGSLIDNDLKIFEEELINAKNQLSQLTSSLSSMDMTSKSYQSKIQSMNGEYEKWSRYASQRIRRLKRLLSEVKLRVEVPEIMHSGAGLWTEECQLLASQETINKESESKSVEASDINNRYELNADLHKLESVKRENDDKEVTQNETTDISYGRNDDKFIQEESDFSREIKSIRHFSRSDYVPVVPKLKQPKTVKVNQRKLRKSQKMDLSASHISRNRPHMHANNCVCNIKVQNEPTHFSKSCFKGKPMVKMRATPVHLNFDRAENVNPKSEVALIAEVNCEVHSSEKSSAIFDEGKNKMPEFNSI